jgi:hypothetical protein
VALPCTIAFIPFSPGFGQIRQVLDLISGRVVEPPAPGVYLAGAQNIVDLAVARGGKTVEGVEHRSKPELNVRGELAAAGAFCSVRWMAGTRRKNQDCQGRNGKIYMKVPIAKHTTPRC